MFSKAYQVSKQLLLFNAKKKETEASTLFSIVTTILSIAGIFVSGLVLLLIVVFLLFFLIISSFIIPINMVSDANETGVLETLNLYEEYATIEGTYKVASDIYRVENNYELDFNFIVAIDTVINGDTGINADNIKDIMKETYYTKIRKERYTVDKKTKIRKILEIHNQSRDIIYKNLRLSKEEIQKLEDAEMLMDEGMIYILADIDYSGNIYDSNVDLSNLRQYDEGSASIIYFSQLDKRWGYEKYGKTSSIAESGCGPTSLAMVVSSLTNKKVYPDEVAEYSAENGYRCEGSGSYWSLIPTYSRKQGLTVTKISKYEPQKVLEKLEQGLPVIAIMGKGDFTKGGHFIVLRGITKDQKILVNDSASVKRTNKEWNKKIIFNQAHKGGIYTYWAIERSD